MFLINQTFIFHIQPNSESTTNQKTLLTEDSCPGHKADWLKADFLLKSKLNWDQKEESEPELLQGSPYY
jgi:hypothetical protein